jgi:hypothetical protein
MSDDLVKIKRRLLGVLWAAAAVSVAANVLSAELTLIGRGVAAWPPVALLLVVEVLARAPLPAGRTRWVSVGGAGLVASVAAVASFSHMHAVAIKAGESALVAVLFPLSVDGLAVVVSVALVEVNRRAAAPAPAPVPTPAPVATAPVVTAPVATAPVEPSSAPVGRTFLAPMAASSPVLNGSGQ